MIILDFTGLIVNNLRAAKCLPKGLPFCRIQNTMEGGVTDLIKGKLDVVEFLKGYLTVTPAGKNFKAVCPFHREKTPSFMISPDRQSWHCFGCGQGGDIFTFLMKHENIEFAEALKFLAEKAGVELQTMRPQEYKFAGLLYDLNSLAREFFVRELKNSESARAYLQKRGLKENTVEEFGIGWAPNTTDSLGVFLLKKGFHPDDIARAGLTFKTDRGLNMDRFRGRIMFPIENHLGKTVGFTGRLLPELDRGDVGKYVNSPESPVFMKSRILYGFSHSKNFIREAEAAFLVEGQMDFLMSWQAGIKNCAATSGTALTPDHLRALRRLTDRIILSFDSDAAGLEAGERAIDLAEESGFEVRVALLKDFKDPAEAVHKDPAILKDAVKNSVTASAFYFEKYLKGVKDKRALTKGIRAILLKAKGIASPLARGLWIKELSEKINISEKTLWEELEKLEPKTAATAKREESPLREKQNFSRWETLSQALVAAAVGLNDFSIAEEHENLLDARSKEALRILKLGAKRSSDQELDGFLNLIILRSGEFAAAQVEDLKNHLFKEYLREKRKELTKLVKEAESRHDEALLKKTLQEITNLPVL